MIRSSQLPNLSQPVVVPGLDRVWHSLSASPVKMGLFAIVVALQAADVITTNHGLSQNGIWEANPFIALLMSYLGGFWWVPIKISFVIYLLIILPRIKSIWPQVFVIGIYIVIFSNNLIRC